MSEHLHQCAVMQWAKLSEKKYPFIDLLHAIPNGGARHIQVAKKLKAEGVKSGVPDLCLPLPRCGYAGLYIEMKYGDNKVSTNQAWWIDRLRAAGHKVIVCWSADEAIEKIKAYMEESLE